MASVTPIAIKTLDIMWSKGYF